MSNATTVKVKHPLGGYTWATRNVDQSSISGESWSVEDLPTQSFEWIEDLITSLNQKYA